MEHPDILADLHGIYGAVRIAAIGQGNFEHPGSQTFHRFGLVGFFAARGDTQGRGHLLLHGWRERLKVPQRRFDL
jgi:hypothetical protein